MVVLLLGGFCLVFLCGAVYVSVDLIRNMLFVRKAQAAEGIVMEVKIETSRRYDSDTKTTQTQTDSYPIVTFGLPDGRSFTFTSDIPSSSLRRRDRARVLYDPAKPDNARIDTFETLYGDRLFRIGLAAAIAAACGYMLFAYLQD